MNNNLSKTEYISLNLLMIIVSIEILSVYFLSGISFKILLLPFITIFIYFKLAELYKVKRGIKEKEDILKSRRIFTEEDRTFKKEEIFNVNKITNDIHLKRFSLKEDYILSDLKIKYKKLSNYYHPDKKTGNKDSMQLINESYMELKRRLKQS